MAGIRQTTQIHIELFLPCCVLRCSAQPALLQPLQEPAETGSVCHTAESTPLHWQPVSFNTSAYVGSELIAPAWPGLETDW